MRVTNFPNFLLPSPPYILPNDPNDNQQGSNECGDDYRFALPKQAKTDARFLNRREYGRYLILYLLGQSKRKNWFMLFVWLFNHVGSCQRKNKEIWKRNQTGSWSSTHRRAIWLVLVVGVGWNDNARWTNWWLLSWLLRSSDSWRGISSSIGSSFSSFDQWETRKVKYQFVALKKKKKFDRLTRSNNLQNVVSNVSCNFPPNISSSNFCCCISSLHSGQFRRGLKPPNWGNRLFVASRIVAAVKTSNELADKSEHRSPKGGAVCQKVIMKSIFFL